MTPRVTPMRVAGFVIAVVAGSGFAAAGVELAWEMWASAADGWSEGGAVGVLVAGAIAWAFAWAALHAFDTRPAPGHCPRCGYDLRATPDYCPECGIVTAPRLGRRPRHLTGVWRGHGTN